MTDQMREEFEKEMRNRLVDEPRLVPHLFITDAYHDDAVQSAWQVWQAAWNRRTPAPKSEAERDVAYAGVHIWIGDQQIKLRADRPAFDYESEPGAAITNLCQLALDKLAHAMSREGE